MSDDRDDIDAALRRAMAALDGEAPAGYFDALPARTLARLDDPALGELPEEPAPLRAVQDLRPPLDDDEDDDAVFSSQIMAAVEPAEPASASSVRVRAVPVDADGELGDPGEPRVAGSDLGAVSASSMITVLPLPAVEPAPPAAAAVGGRPPGAAASTTEADRGRRRRRMRAAIAGIGAIGLAAIAMMYLAAAERAPRSARSIAPAGPREVMRSAPSAESPSADSSVSAVAGGSAASGDPVARGNTIISAKPAGVASGAASGSAVTPSGATAGSGVAPGLASGSTPEAGDKLGPIVKRPGGGRPLSKGGEKPEPPLAPGTAGKRAGAAKQTGVDALLSDDSEVPGKKVKSPRPRPDRTSLSSDDIERAMTAVAGQARACVAGTRATASLRLTVAPSGRIAQVAVTGRLAGTPAAACLGRTVQAATFPPWSGAAQSFDYSYPLSD